MKPLAHLNHRKEGITMPNFRSILPAELSGNAIQRISKQWALASAQKPDGAVNTMTISWGGLGYLWNQPVAFLFVRPQRYTYEFVESADGFSLCFFPEKYRKELQYCGTISGRDEDKIAHCGFTVAHQDGVPYFEEAEAVLICKKIYAQNLTGDCALSELVTNQYPTGDYHRMYVGAIQTVLVRDDA